MSDINNTLQERGSNYGSFERNAAVMQGIKRVMKGDVKLVEANGNTLYIPATNWNNLSAAHKESLEMVSHKSVRIINGNSNHKDSWHDISGYAQLGEDACQE